MSHYINQIRDQLGQPDTGMVSWADAGLQKDLASWVEAGAGGAGVVGAGGG